LQKLKKYFHKEHYLQKSHQTKIFEHRHHEKNIFLGTKLENYFLQISTKTVHFSDIFFPVL